MANDLFQKMAHTIIEGDSDVAAELAQQAIAQRTDPQKRYQMALSWA